MKRIKFLFAALALLSGVMACTKTEETTTPQSLLPQVTLTIVPDYTDGTVDNYNPNTNCMLLSIEVTPFKYAEVLADTSRFIHKVVFSPVKKTKADFGNAFTVTPSSIIYNQGAPIPFLELMLGLDEMSVWMLENGTYAVSCTIEDKDGVHGASTAFVPISYEKGSGEGGGQTDNAVPAGALPGKFTVDNDGKQVYFSQGNLWYDGNSRKWSFENNQYEYHTYDSGNNTWGLFGWVGESSGVNTAPEKYGVSISTATNDDYGYVKKEPLKSDWGNTINNEGTWRTLSTHEWNHILTTRAGASDKVGYATVNGVHGIIILPDGEFADPAKNTSTKANEKKFVPKATTEWDSNVYSADDWKAMQSAGAVFLPAAGERIGSDVTKMGEQCYYWTSSAGDKTEGSAYYVRANNTEIYLDKTSRRHLSHSVRLATDCK